MELQEGLIWKKYSILNWSNKSVIYFRCLDWQYLLLFPFCLSERKLYAVSPSMYLTFTLSNLIYFVCIEESNTGKY